MNEFSLHDYDELFEFRNLVKQIVITFPEVKRKHEDTVISRHNMHGVDYNIKS